MLGKNTWTNKLFVIVSPAQILQYFNTIVPSKKHPFRQERGFFQDACKLPLIQPLLYSEMKLIIHSGPSEIPCFIV